MTRTIRTFLAENFWGMVVSAVLVIGFAYQLDAKQDQLQLQLIELRATVKEGNAILAGALKDHTVGYHNSLKGPFRDALAAVERHTLEIQAFQDRSDRQYIAINELVEKVHKVFVQQARQETRSDAMDAGIKEILTIMRRFPTE
jgi:hypothetical protein